MTMIRTPQIPGKLGQVKRCTALPGPQHDVALVALGQTALGRGEVALRGAALVSDDGKNKRPVWTPLTWKRERRGWWGGERGGQARRIV